MRRIPLLSRRLSNGEGSATTEASARAAGPVAVAGAAIAASCASSKESVRTRSLLPHLPQVWGSDDRDADHGFTVTGQRVRRFHKTGHTRAELPVCHSGAPKRSGGEPGIQQPPTEITGFRVLR